MINQKNQLSKINDSRQALNTQQMNEIQASEKADLKFRTEINAAT